MLEAPQARAAEASDSGEIARIYNQGIADRIATFETALQTAAQVQERLTRLQATYPAVVVDDDGRVRAFAWTSEYRPRACYAGVTEFSVYVEREARQHGLGRLALTALIAEAERRGFHKLVSRIFPENVGSRRLCAAVGFREVGIYYRHGKLDGRWQDCVIVERVLGEAADGPG